MATSFNIQRLHTQLHHIHRYKYLYIKSQLSEQTQNLIKNGLSEQLVHRRPASRTKLRLGQPRQAAIRAPDVWPEAADIRESEVAIMVGIIGGRGARLCSNRRGHLAIKSSSLQVLCYERARATSSDPAGIYVP